MLLLVSKIDDTNLPHKIWLGISVGILFLEFNHYLICLGLALRESKGLKIMIIIKLVIINPIQVAAVIVRSA